MSAPIMPFEDEVCDVLAKAMRGRRTSPRALASELDVTPEALRPVLRRGEPLEMLARLAPLLGLNAAALAALQANPAPAEEPTLPGLTRVTTNYPATGEPRMTVNAYFVVIPHTTEAILFDAGSDPQPMIDALAAEGVTPKALYLTHDHPDHRAALPALSAAFPEMAVWGQREHPASPAKTITPGTVHQHTPLSLSVRATPGHAVDGLTFIVEGLAQPVAFVGDAIFARSAGGIAPEVYPDSHTIIRREILSLPAPTILAAGHGPLTTVATEQAHNPFFAESV